VAPFIAGVLNSRRTGLQLGGGLTEADEGDYFVRLKSGSRRPIEAVMGDIRQEILAKVPGLQVETAQLMEDLIGDLTAVPQPIEIKLFGDNPAELEMPPSMLRSGSARLAAWLRWSTVCAWRATPYRSACGPAPPNSTA
jgi:hypothetical protein